MPRSPWLLLLPLASLLAGCGVTTHSLVIKNGAPAPLDEVAVVVWDGGAGSSRIASADGHALLASTSRNRLELGPGVHDVSVLDGHGTAFPARWELRPGRCYQVPAAVGRAPALTDLGPRRSAGPRACDR